MYTDGERLYNSFELIDELEKTQYMKVILEKRTKLYKFFPYRIFLNFALKVGDVHCVKLYMKPRNHIASFLTRDCGYAYYLGKKKLFEIKLFNVVMSSYELLFARHAKELIDMIITKKLDMVPVTFSTELRDIYNIKSVDIFALDVKRKWVADVFQNEVKGWR